MREPLFRLLALGDVRIGADEPGRGTGFVPFDTGATAFNPDPMAVSMPLAILENLIIRVAGILTIDSLYDEFPIVRVDELDPRIIVAVGFLIGRHAAHDFPRVGIIALAKTKIVIPDAEARSHKSVVPAALALREFSTILRRHAAVKRCSFDLGFRFGPFIGSCLLQTAYSLF